MGGGLYIVSIARARQSENAYFAWGGVGFVKRKTRFSGCQGGFSASSKPFRHEVGGYWAFGAVVSVAVWRGGETKLSAEQNRQNHFV